jgi:hypothetical protein
VHLKKNYEAFQYSGAREPICVRQLILSAKKKKKKRVTMQNNVSNVREVGRIGGLPLLSSLKIVMRRSCPRECHGKDNGKKKVMGMERKSRG